MLAVVKTPHTEFIVQGDIPEKYLKMLKTDYGKNVTISEVTGSKETLDIFKTKWYKEIDSENTPGETMKFYRKLYKLTQKELANRLEIAVQSVSNMETGVRPISKATAKMLAEIFNISAGRFI